MIHSHRSLSSFPGGNFRLHAVDTRCAAERINTALKTKDNHHCHSATQCRRSTVLQVPLHTIDISVLSAHLRSPQPALQSLPACNCLSHITALSTGWRHSTLRHTPFSVFTTRRQHTRGYFRTLCVTSETISFGFRSYRISVEQRVNMMDCLIPGKWLITA